MLNGRPVQDFLISLGYKFATEDKPVEIPAGFTLEQLINSRHYRIKCREKIDPTPYGLLFEKVVEQLLLSSFRFDILKGVKFEDEGTGGDFDILAFQSPHLHYIECKTSTSNIKIKEIFKRHKFLRPSLTLILIDRPKDEVAQVVYKEIQEFLTAELKSKDTKSKYPIEEISATESSFVLYNTYRNIFIASGEDLDKVIRKTLRHFHQVVQQSSYFS